MVFPFPTARRGQAPSLAIGQAYSILESSPNKEAAALYLRGALEGWYERSTPFDREALLLFDTGWSRRMLEFDEEKPPELRTSFGSEEAVKLSKPPSKALVDSYLQIQSQVETALIDSLYLTDSLILPEMTPYFEDQKSLDDCVEALQNKLTLYLNE